MKKHFVSRRRLLQGTGALALGTVFAAPARARGAAGRGDHAAADRGGEEGRQGRLYSSMDLPVGEKLGKAFEAAYPGIQIQIERSGSERLFQRIAQEFDSNIHAADVINSSDAAHFIPWKKNGWLMPFVSEDIAKYLPKQYRDPDGMFATSRIWLSSIAINTNLVKPEDAPKSYADLLDPEMGGQDGEGPSRL